MRTAIGRRMRGSSSSGNWHVELKEGMCKLKRPRVFNEMEGGEMKRQT